MIAEAVPLQFTGLARFAFLRDLTGYDERAVSSTSTADAIRLIDSLLENPHLIENTTLQAVQLTASDRDRLLATIYERVFGDRIENTLTCTACGKPFDLHFSLRELTESVYSRVSLDERLSSEKLTMLPDGRFETSDGIGTKTLEGSLIVPITFRLPTGADEIELAGLPPEEASLLLLSRCMQGNTFPDNGSRGFEEMLDDLAPIMDIELTAFCAECGHVHTIEFDIQSYLLGAFLGERRRLMREVHRIAAFYGWSLDEILTLERSERRQLVDLIEDETPRQQGVLR